MKKEVTLEKVAEECGYSLQTISKVLNGDKSISKHAKYNVMKAVNKVGYVHKPRMKKESNIIQLRKAS